MYTILKRLILKNGRSTNLSHIEEDNYEIPIIYFLRMSRHGTHAYVGFFEKGTHM